jgi:hypothetical protein
MAKEHELKGINIVGNFYTEGLKADGDLDLRGTGVEEERIDEEFEFLLGNRNSMLKELDFSAEYIMHTTHLLKASKGILLKLIVEHKETWGQKPTERELTGAMLWMVMYLSNYFVK